MKPKITVYVKSDKVFAGTTLVEEPYPVKRVSRFHDTVYKVRLKKKYNYILPDNQAVFVKTVKRLSERHGLELKIIDMTQETVLGALWRNLRGIKNFPVLETKRGGRLMAPFSESELERFISETA